MKRLVWACACLISIVLPSWAQAGSIVVGGFDASRVYRPFSGTSYSTVRARMADPALFGPGGITDEAVSYAPDVTTVTAEYLAGVSLFVMTEVMGNLGGSEAEALADFVRDGGCLAIITDTLHASMPYGFDGSFAGNAVLGLLGGGSISSIDTVGTAGLLGDQTATAGMLLDYADSQIMHGPFGQLAAGTAFGASWHNMLSAGPNSHLIGMRAGSGVLMEISGGVLGPGSGKVLVTGDILFSNSFIPTGNPSLQNENNALLWLNFVADCGCTCKVPEPATGSLALAGLAALACLRRRAGQRRN